MPDSALFQTYTAVPTLQYKGNHPVFREIVTKLTDGNPGTCQSIFNLSTTLEKQLVDVEDFKLFLQAVHDYLVTANSPGRSTIFRVIRYCLTTLAHVQAVVDEQVHYIVVMSMEKESDYSMERIQALKIIDRSRRVCGHTNVYPAIFARSLVSIANSKEDNFRKIAVESLRELTLSNPTLVASVQGFPSLMDAIIDPVTQDIADSVMHTVLFLMNDPATRCV
jgi:rapamycin-insensitive companion of mTOR